MAVKPLHQVIIFHSICSLRNYLACVKKIRLKSSIYNWNTDTLVWKKSVKTKVLISRIFFRMLVSTFLESNFSKSSWKHNHLKMCTKCFHEFFRGHFFKMYPFVKFVKSQLAFMFEVLHDFFFRVWIDDWQAAVSRENVSFDAKILFLQRLRQDCTSGLRD